MCVIICNHNPARPSEWWFTRVPPTLKCKRVPRPSVIARSLFAFSFDFLTLKNERFKEAERLDIKGKVTHWEAEGSQVASSHSHGKQCRLGHVRLHSQSDEPFLHSVLHSLKLWLCDETLCSARHNRGCATSACCFTSLSPELCRRQKCIMLH